MSDHLLAFLSRYSAFSVTDVARIISSAPRRYKVFSISKKSGRGIRVVAQPSRELKTIQRIVVSHILGDLPVHNACHGFVSERGIKTNGQAHVEGRYILKMDLKDFFPSLVPSDLLMHVKKYLPDRFRMLRLRASAVLYSGCPRVSDP